MIENGYSLCLNQWAMDNDIKNELGLLLIISSLSAKLGYCTASNEYLSNLFNETKDSIGRKIKKLERKGYIKCEYTYRGSQILSRKIYSARTKKMSLDDRQDCRWTTDRIVGENNISNNIKDIPNGISFFKEKKISENGFSVPSISEIESEFQKHGFTDMRIAQSFFNHYENKSWYIGKNKMKNWKLAISTWVHNPDNEKKYKTTQTEPKEDYAEMLRRKRNNGN
jgi:hypothetical protein